LAREQQELGDWAGELGFENSFSNDQSGGKVACSFNAKSNSKKYFIYRRN